jgi:hypothetical protein
MLGRLGMKPPSDADRGNLGCLGEVWCRSELLGVSRNEVTIPTAKHCFSTSNGKRL